MFAVALLRRSPHGERGLKFTTRRLDVMCQVSLSSWRAWIEMGSWDAVECPVKSLSSWRAWIEMWIMCADTSVTLCRSPHGERGLKYEILGGELVGFGSLSSWRAWIEMGCNCLDALLSESLSSWRAWIEIYAKWTPNTRFKRRSPHGERGLK